MKVWDEEEILQELVDARLAEAAELKFQEEKTKQEGRNNNSNNNKRLRRNNSRKLRRNNSKSNNNNNNNNNNNTPTYTDKRTKLPFLLILVRKVQRQCYEFIYHPAETYERIDEVYQLTPVEEAPASSEDDRDDEGAVWTGGNASASPSSSSDEEEDNITEERQERSHDHLQNQRFEPYFVGKAIFHTASGEVLLKIEGSLGWREALKQKYESLDAKSKAEVTRQLNETTKKGGRNRAAAKAAVASTAAIGSYAAAGMMATTTTEAAAVTTGGLTATMQTIGTVGVMASPVGVGLAAAGAIGGLGTYYLIRRRNKAKKKRVEEEKEKFKHLEEMAQELAAAGEEPATNDYQRLSEDDVSDEAAAEAASEENNTMNFWVLVSAKKVEMEESDHCFDHEAFEDRIEADQNFLEVASNTTAKALFDPHGIVRRVDCDPTDRDGWETALSLHYSYLIEQDLLPTSSTTTANNRHKDHATEDTPLLLRDEAEEEEEDL